MRAATWAHRKGRGVSFARTAFRHAFVRGFDLARPENVQAADRLDQALEAAPATA